MKTVKREESWGADLYPWSLKKLRAQTSKITLSTASSMPGWNFGQSGPQLSPLQSCRASMCWTRARMGADTKSVQFIWSWSRNAWNLITWVETISGFEPFPAELRWTKVSPSWSMCPKINVCSLVPRHLAGMTILWSRPWSRISWLGVSTKSSASASMLILSEELKKGSAIAVVQRATPRLSASTSVKWSCSTGTSKSSWKCALSSSNWSGSSSTGAFLVLERTGFLCLWFRTCAPCWVLALCSMYADCSSWVMRRNIVPGLLAAAFKSAHGFLLRSMVWTCLLPSLARTCWARLVASSLFTPLVERSSASCVVVASIPPAKMEPSCCKVRSHWWRRRMLVGVSMVTRPKSNAMFTKAIVPQVDAWVCESPRPTWSPMHPLPKNLLSLWAIFHAVGSVRSHWSPSKKVHMMPPPTWLISPLSKIQWFSTSQMT